MLGLDEVGGLAHHQVMQTGILINKEVIIELFDL